MRAWQLLLGIAIGVGASWLWQLHHAGPSAAALVVAAPDRDDAHDKDARAARAAESAPAPIHLDATARELADIKSEPVQATRVTIEHYTPGRVLDGGELLAALRERRTARDALHAQQELLATQAARLERLRSFAARGEITVARELNALELSVRREADVAASRAAQVASSEAALRARWGVGLASHDGLQARLAAGDAQLVEFAASSVPAAIYVGRDEQRAAAVTAQVLGAAPAALGTAPAATWVALVPDPSLRVAMRVSVWVPQGDAQVSGVLLPNAAIVWHAGAQWYFVETAAGEFERRRLGAALHHGLGIVVSEGLDVGAMVVVRGAQALLAEQLRQRIPSEDDD